MREGRIEISKLDYIVPNGRIWSSCNGLMLSRNVERKFLYVTNITTQQTISLPQFGGVPLVGSGLVYVKSTMKYKVLLTYQSQKPFVDYRCAILTIGVDKIWRNVHTEHLSREIRRAFFGLSPMCLGEFMAWCRQDFVLAFSAETETFRRFPVPRDYLEKHKYYLAMGSNISFVSCCNEFPFEVWEMKMETGEWTKCMDIDLQAQRFRPQQLIFKSNWCLGPVAKYCLIPSGWLKPREALLFRVWPPSNLCIVYDVKTQEIQSFELDTNQYDRTFHVHVNSLVSLEG